jgi:hypothetical protein
MVLDLCHHGCWFGGVFDGWTGWTVMNYDELVVLLLMQWGSWMVDLYLPCTIQFIASQCGCLVDSTSMACVVVSSPHFTMAVSHLWELCGMCISFGWDLIPLPELISSCLLVLLTKWHCHLFLDNPWFFCFLFL